MDFGVYKEREREQSKDLMGGFFSLCEFFLAFFLKMSF
jgi:hypothetical protein